MNFEFEEYRQQRRKVEKEIKVELDEASFRAQTCEVNLKECKNNTTEIAELADKSHLFEKSLQEDLTEKFQTQIKELEAIILNKKEEIKAITSYSEQAIEQLRETLRLSETTTKTLEQQLKDKETEITNLWTSYNYLQEKLQTNVESEIDLTTRFADATVRESGVNLT